MEYTLDKEIAASLRGWGMEVNEERGGAFVLPSTKSTRASLMNTPETNLKRLIQEISSSY